MSAFTLAGVSIFTPIWRPLTLGFTAAVSDPILLWQRRIHRQHLTFGVTQTTLDKPHTNANRKDSTLAKYRTANM